MSMKSSDFSERVYDDGRTKQAFKDSTDINKIIAKAQKAGTLAHLQKYDKAVYGEFENYDLLEAYNKLNRANEIFADLPSEIRNEFGNDAIKFAGFASDPTNVDRLGELLPQLAEPGRQWPQPGDEPQPPSNAVVDAARALLAAAGGNGGWSRS